MGFIKVLIICFLFVLPAEALNSLNKVRASFPAALDSEETTNKLFDQLHVYIEENDPMIQGYIGALYTLKAKHSFNPMSRLYYLRKGMGLINAAINKNQGSAELRMLRYRVESKAPGVLIPEKHLADDRKSLLNYLTQTTPAKENVSLVQAVSASLQEEKDLSENHKQLISKRLLQCKQF
ncbi:MAG: hypothetical protein KJS92_09930 [Bacteroidetes bacterium]|nr:hypothetical protein [Bacteroidota bacterium]